MHNLKIIIFAFGYLFLISCGSSKQIAEGKKNLSEDLNLACQKFNKRFTDCEVDLLYNDSFELIDQVYLPKSKRPKKDTLDFENADKELQDEWSFGDQLNLFKGYVNFGRNLSEDDFKNLISFFEAISKYNKVRDSRGRRIFENSFNSTATWSRIPDAIDGRVAPNGDYFNLVLEVLASGIKVGIKSGMTVTRDDEKISIYLRNERPVKTFLTGTILKRDGIRIKWEFYPYRNGFLVWGVAIITPEKFSEEIKTIFSSDFSDSVFNWFENRAKQNYLEKQPL